MAESGDKATGNNDERIAERLAEVFTCCICMEKLVDAHLCPRCSKLCCYACIKRWLRRGSRCPQCRAALHLRELVKCRWVEEVTQQIGTMQGGGALPQRDDSRDGCSKHHEELSDPKIICQNGTRSTDCVSSFVQEVDEDSDDDTIDAETDEDAETHEDLEHDSESDSESSEGDSEDSEVQRIIATYITNLHNDRKRARDNSRDRAPKKSKK